MDMPTLKIIAQDVVIFCSAIGAVFYGFKRIYKTARNIENLVESTEKNAKIQKEYSEAAIITRQELKDDLAMHITQIAEVNVKRDEKIAALATALTQLTTNLNNHIGSEDVQLAKFTTHINEIILEIRSNGGLVSIKNVLKDTKKTLDSILERVLILENVNIVDNNKKFEKTKKTKKIKKK